MCLAHLQTSINSPICSGNSNNSGEPADCWIDHNMMQVWGRGEPEIIEFCVKWCSRNYFIVDYQQLCCAFLFRWAWSFIRFLWAAHFWSFASFFCHISSISSGSTSDQSGRWPNARVQLVKRGLQPHIPEAVIVFPEHLIRFPLIFLMHIKHTKSALVLSIAAW